MLEQSGYSCDYLNTYGVTDIGTGPLYYDMFGDDLRDSGRCSLHERDWIPASDFALELSQLVTANLYFFDSETVVRYYAVKFQDFSPLCRGDATVITGDIWIAYLEYNGKRDLTYTVAKELEGTVVEPHC